MPGDRPGFRMFAHRRGDLFPRQSEAPPDTVGGATRQEWPQRLAQLAQVIVSDPAGQRERVLRKRRSVFQNGLNLLQTGPVSGLSQTRDNAYHSAGAEGNQHLGADANRGPQALRHRIGE